MISGWVALRALYTAWYGLLLDDQPWTGRFHLLAHHLNWTALCWSGGFWQTLHVNHLIQHLKQKHDSSVCANYYILCIGLFKLLVVCLHFEYMTTLCLPTYVVIQREIKDGDHCRTQSIRPPMARLMVVAEEYWQSGIQFCIVFDIPQGNVFKPHYFICRTTS